MQFAEKQHILANNREVFLTSPTVSEADELLKYMIQRAEETDYMIKDADECGTIEEMKSTIRQYIESPYNLMILCKYEGRIVACAEMNRLLFRKVHHRAEISIGVLKSNWGWGIGTLLMRSLIQRAQSCGISQLELNVFEGNDKALRMYERLGFEATAIRPNCVHLADGRKLGAVAMYLSIK